ncbi:MAG TPA: 50S ribosomal protein L24 [Candidatus Saccharimonadales bacterium]|nr:50S ribosomal protein L24 [Candidatus Saccharimonadales bacterium]
MKIRINDTVKVISGAHKGKVAKVVSVQPKDGTVKLEGIGLRKRFVKPSTVNPQGGSRDIHVAMPVSKVALVNPADSKKTTRVGFEVKKDGSKVRIAKQADNKEIK